MERQFSFIWDGEKEIINILKHGVDFITASKAFKDPKRKIFIDSKHSKTKRAVFLYRQSGRGNYNGKISLLWRQD